MRIITVRAAAYTVSAETSARSSPLRARFARERPLAGRAFERAVAVLRHLHLVAPAQALHPALVGELARGGGERIVDGVEEIDLAVAVPVVGVVVVFRGHELREADRAGPG